MLPLLIMACQGGAALDSAPDGWDPEALRRVLAMSPPGAPPPDPTNAVADDPDAARLGQALYFDTRLSGNGRVACSTCHDPDRGFADGEPRSTGIAETARHAPHVTNAAYNRWFFWDGRADSQWAQALGPLESEAEHGGSRLQYVHLVAEDAALRAAYEAAFGPMPDVSDPARFPATGRPVPGQPDHPYALAWASMRPEDQDTVTAVFVRLGKSIAAYERRIGSGETPLDAYVAALRDEDPGASTVLSAPAQRGLALFVGAAGCHFCHSGPQLSDWEFHNIGLPDLDGSGGADPGRYAGIEAVRDAEFNGVSAWSDDATAGAEKLQNLYQGPEHYGQFKTPGLRDVARTAPYMHDGRFATLEEVVAHYNAADTEPALGHREELLVPLDLSEAEQADLVRFLEEALRGTPIDEALTGPP